MHWVVDMLCGGTSAVGRGVVRESSPHTGITARGVITILGGRLACARETEIEGREHVIALMLGLENSAAHH